MVSLDSIAGSVVVLPQIVPALRNNTPRRPLTPKYRDPFSWDLKTLHSMLAAFFHASATTSIPPLEEYTKLPDKVSLPLFCSTEHLMVNMRFDPKIRTAGHPVSQRSDCLSSTAERAQTFQDTYHFICSRQGWEPGSILAFLRCQASAAVCALSDVVCLLRLQMYLQEAYEDYHAEDPVQRVPPIPTVKLSAPGTPKEHSLLCYTDRKYTATESHIDAIMKTIYLGLVKLDAMIPPDSEIRAVQVQALKCSCFCCGACLWKSILQLESPVLANRNTEHSGFFARSIYASICKGPMKWSLWIRIPQSPAETPHPPYAASAAQEHGVESGERAFIIKRNLSNAATHVLTVRVPDWLLEQACLTHASNWSSVHPCLDGGMAPWRAGPSLALSDDLSTGTQQILLKYFAPQPLNSVFLCRLLHPPLYQGSKINLKDPPHTKTKPPNYTTRVAFLRNIICPQSLVCHSLPSWLQPASKWLEREIVAVEMLELMSCRLLYARFTEGCRKPFLSECHG